MLGKILQILLTTKEMSETAQPKSYKIFERILFFLDKVLTFFEEWTLFIAVIVALISLFVHIFFRIVFNLSIPWTEELVREVIIYTTFIGCSAAVKNRSLIKIDASIQLLPNLKMLLTYFSHFITMIFGSMMIYYGALMVQLQHRTQEKTIILEIPLIILYAILPLMGVMMLIRAIQVVYQDIIADGTGEQEN